MPDEILTDFKREGEPAFPVETAENPAPESSPENNQPNVTPSSEGEPAATPPGQDGSNTQTEDKTPFDEHPRWKALLEKDKQRDAELAELRAFREQASPILDKFSPKEETNIPIWFGGDEAQWKAYLADQARIVEEAQAKAVAAIESKTQAEQERIQAANVWFESSVSEIESTGAKVDRNKLLKFVMDNQLIDTEGRWNYKKGYEFMTALERAKQEPSNLSDRKNLAAATTSESKAEDKPTDVQTSASLKKMGGVW